MEHIFFEVQLCIKISIFNEFCEFSIFFARLLLGAQYAECPPEHVMQFLGGFKT